ncbi:NAD(P)-dependent oxidoreductase [Saccharolobus caldissimus]|uniref:6-phosphogluconate dehydrogenase n=1 Tax=Saccharolobus caldissimus TaxID=1702097 RepID=A0AAQ4CV07_9CREN|nr:NAD(P)-dependent oxidoreductase [Saccharolobus caldissimus]BDB99638.1 6-phosphogluconate dehydrogenase [Saccharolobus caldissimus]
MKVGFIGLGIMGFPMASNLIKAGYDLTVYNRTIEKAEKLKGAKVARSPKEVAENSDVVISMVTDAPDVEEILFGENGVVKSNKRGLIFVDMSTNSPEFAKKTAKRLSEYGIEFLDAPVTGGDKGAREGTLTIMVGGKESIFKQVEPIFRAMGKTIIYVGDVGSGQALKLCNQVVVALNMVAVVEGLLLARSFGIDDEKLFTVLSTGAANSFTVQYYLPKIMKGDFEPGFKAAHLKKDLKYALEIANSKSLPLLGTSLALQLYNAMVSIGMGEKGTQGLIKVYEKMISK